MKQYIKNKSTKWDAKVFVLCNADGLMYDFILYQETQTEFNSDLQFGQGAAVVMQLTEIISKPHTEVYFDNYFATFHLFEWLKL